MPKVIDAVPEYLFKRNMIIREDFLEFVTADLMTSLAADSGASAAVGDAAGGIMALTTGATDNNEAAVRTTKELFLVADNKPMIGLCYLTYTEANTDDANVAFGFANAFGANLLLDDGAGPKTSGNFVLIYKVDGGTVWRCASRNSTTLTDSVSTATADVSSLVTQQQLRIEVVPTTASECAITYFVNNEQLIDSTTLKPIVHSMLYASATEMNLGAYVKAGGANSEVLNVDLIVGVQLDRING